MIFTGHFFFSKAAFINKQKNHCTYCMLQGHIAKYKDIFSPKENLPAQNPVKQNPQKPLCFSNKKKFNPAKKIKR
jgi:hypothetical protein